MSEQELEYQAGKAGCELVKFELDSPVEITSRLMAGVRVGGATISIEYGGVTEDRRRKYHYFIDLPDGTEYESDDIASGVGGGTLQSGLENLLGFLSACGESWNYVGHDGERGENADLFTPVVAEWASQNSDELESFEFELRENPKCIVELKN